MPLHGFASQAIIVKCVEDLAVLNYLQVFCCENELWPKKEEKSRVKVSAAGLDTCKEAYLARR